MTLQKATNDHSVSYISQDDDLHSEQTPPFSKGRNKISSNNKLSRRNKKFIKNLTGEGYRIFK